MQATCLKKLGENIEICQLEDEFNIKGMIDQWKNKPKSKKNISETTPVLNNHKTGNFIP